MRTDCLHGHNQHVAWPHVLAGGKSARQAGTESRRDVTSTQHETRWEKMLYFVETTCEVAETVIFRQYVPVESR